MENTKTKNYDVAVVELADLVGGVILDKRRIKYNLDQIVEILTPIAPPEMVQSIKENKCYTALHMVSTIRDSHLGEQPQRPFGYQQPHMGMISPYDPRMASVAIIAPDSRSCLSIRLNLQVVAQVQAVLTPEALFEEVLVQVQGPESWTNKGFSSSKG